MVKYAKLIFLIAVTLFISVLLPFGKAYGNNAASNQQASGIGAKNYNNIIYWSPSVSESGNSGFDADELTAEVEALELSHNKLKTINYIVLVVLSITAIAVVLFGVIIIKAIGSTDERILNQVGSSETNLKKMLQNKFDEIASNLNFIYNKVISANKNISELERRYSDTGHDAEERLRMDGLSVQRAGRGIEVRNEPSYHTVEERPRPEVRSQPQRDLLPADEYNRFINSTDNYAALSQRFELKRLGLGGAKITENPDGGTECYIYQTSEKYVVEVYPGSLIRAKVARDYFLTLYDLGVSASDEIVLIRPCLAERNAHGVYTVLKKGQIRVRS